MPPADPCILGLDIGSTKLSLSLWSSDHECLAAEKMPTSESDWESTLEAILPRLKDLARDRVTGRIGVSAGGPVDRSRGLLLDMPNRRGWKDAPLAGWLETHLGVPVAIENDANACTLAEWKFGAGRGCDHLAFLTFSTGIGAGLILDGRLYRGARQLAGEVGHQVIVPDGAPCGCGGNGCLEAYASGAGIARRLAELRATDPSWPRDARGLVDCARRGERRAIEILEEVAGHLARGLANLVFTLDLRKIILGTIAVGAGDLILEPLDRELERILWPSLKRGLEIVPACLGEKLGDYSALAVALHAGDLS